MKDESEGLIILCWIYLLNENLFYDRQGNQTNESAASPAAERSVIIKKESKGVFGQLWTIDAYGENQKKISCSAK